MLLPGQPQQGRPEQRPRGEIERSHRLLPRQPVHSGAPHRHGQRGQVDPRQGERPGLDALHRPPRLDAKGGAQRLVPADDLPDRAVEGRAVERAAQPERARHVVGRGARCDLVEQPQPLLREGERRRPGLLHAGRLRSGGPAAPEGLHLARDLLQHRPLEQAEQRQLDAEDLAEGGDQPGPQQRVPAEVEEVVPRAHPAAGALRAEDLHPQARQHLLRRRARRHVAVGSPLRGDPGERAAVHLAVRRQRQPLQPHHRRRHQRLRQARGQPPPQLLPFGAAGDIGHQALVGPLPAHQHSRRGDPGVPGEHRLHLRRLDAVAADLHLAVEPAADLQETIRAKARAVARAVEAGAWLKGIGRIRPIRPIRRITRRRRQEALGREIGPSEIPARQAFAAEPQLPPDAQGGRGQPRLQHVRRGVRDRPADRQRVLHRVGGGERVAGREGGALGGAVAVHQHQVRVRREHPAHRLRGDHVAAGQQAPQALEGVRPLLRHLVEQARGQPEPAHRVARQEGRQLVERGRMRREDHHPPAVGKRPPQLQGRGIEGGRREHQERGVRAERAEIRPPDQPHDVAVGDRHPLRLARRARGEHRVDQVPRGRSAGRAIGRTVRRQGDDVEPFRQEVAVGGEGEAGTGEGEHGRQALARQRRIERNEETAALHHREEGGDQGRRAAGADGDRYLRPRSPPAQVVGQPVRGGVELRIGPGLPLGAEGHGVRRAVHLLLEQTVQRPVPRDLHGRTVPGMDDRLLLLRREQRQRGDPPLRRRESGPGEGQKVPHPAGYGRRIEQVEVELQLSGETGRRLDERAGEIELRRRARRLDRHQGEAGERRRGPRCVLQRPHHLEQRRARGPALRLYRLDHLLERNLLQVKRLQRRPPGALQGLAERRIAGQIGAHHQAVDEEADQPLHVAVRAVRDHRAHRDVVLAGEAVKKGLAEREQHHVDGGLLLAGERRHALQAPGRKDGRPRGAAPAAHRGPRPVGRQLQRRHAVQQAPPGREALLQARPGQPPPLPAREARVLQGKLGQRGRPAGGERGVEEAHLAEEHAHRPAVADHVVHGVERRMLLRRLPAQPQQSRPEQRTRREVERPRRLFPGQGVERGALHRLGQAGEVDQRQPGGGQPGRPRRDALHRPPRLDAESGAQRLVPAHDLADHPAERRDVEVSQQAQRARHVVGRRARSDLVEQPEPLLRERELRPLLRGRFGLVHRSPAGGEDLQLPRDILQHRPLEQHLQRQLHPEGVADRGGQPGGEQRMPAQLEEMVPRPHPSSGALGTEDLLPQAGQRLLGRRARRDVPLRRLPPLGSDARQRPPVHLAVVGQRQALQPHHRRRHQRLRQARREPPPQLLPLDVTGHIGHQALVAPLAAHQHCRGDHPGVSGEHRLHLRRLDAVAADLHLAVEPAADLQQAVRPAARTVARAVEAGAGGKGIGRSRPIRPIRRITRRRRQETFRREIRPAEIPARQAFAAEPQLPPDPRGRGRQPRLQHVRRGVRDRPADRQRVLHRVGGGERVAGREGGALGGAVAVHQHQVRVRREHPAHRLRGDHVAAGQQAPQALEGVRPLLRHLVEQARGQPEPAHRVARQEGRQLVERGRMRREDHHPPAVGKRPPQLQGRGIEGGRREHQERGVRAERAEIRPPDQPHDVAVGDRHPLRLARRARGEHRVEEVPRGRSAVRAIRGAIRCQGKDIEPLRQERAVGGEGEARAGEGEDGRQALARQRRIEGDEEAATLHHREEGGDQGRRALGADGDRHLRPRSPPAQVVSQPVRGGVELRVRPGLPLRTEGHGVRRAVHLLLEQAVQRPVARNLDGRPVPGVDDRLALLRSEQRKRGDPALRVGHRGGGERAQVSHPARHRRRLEKIEIEFHAAGQAGRDLTEGQREIELRRRPRRLPPRHHDPRRRRVGPRCVLERQHHLEQRRARGMALRLQRLDHLLERDLLEMERVQRRLAGAPHHLAERRIAREIGAHHQAVDEEPDEPLDVAIRAVGDGGAHGDVVLPRQAVEEDLEQGQKRHVERRPLLPAERREALHLRRREGHRQRRPAPAAHRRARPVARQFQGLQAVQKTAPGGEALLQARPFQPLPLPARKVRILQRQLRQGRRLPGGERRIEGAHLAEEHAGGPAVADDVVQRVKQQVLARAEDDGQGAKQRPPLQIERTPRLRRRQPLGLRLPRRLRQCRQVGLGERAGPKGKDALHRPSPLRGEHRTQRRMPALDLGEHPRESPAVERTLQVDRPRDGVGGRARRELIEQPHPLLRKRSRSLPPRLPRRAHRHRRSRRLLPARQLQQRRPFLAGKPLQTGRQITHCTLQIQHLQDRSF